MCLKILLCCAQVNGAAGSSDPRGKDNVVLKVGSVMNGRIVWIPVTEAKLLATPRWKDGDPSPPVKAREAMKLANIALVRYCKVLNLNCTKKTARLQHVRLTPTQYDRWYWEVKYELLEPGVDLIGTPLELRMVVLMDGTTPEVEQETIEVTEWRKHVVPSTNRGSTIRASMAAKNTKGHKELEQLILSWSHPDD